MSDPVFHSGEKRYMFQIEGISNFRVSTHCRLLLFFQKNRSGFYSPCVEDGMIPGLENFQSIWRSQPTFVLFVCLWAKIDNSAWHSIKHPGFFKICLFNHFQSLIFHAILIRCFVFLSGFPGWARKCSFSGPGAAVMIGTTIPFWSVSYISRLHCVLSQATTFGQKCCVCFPPAGRLIASKYVMRAVTTSLNPIENHSVDSRSSQSSTNGWGTVPTDLWLPWIVGDCIWFGWVRRIIQRLEKWLSVQVARICTWSALSESLLD